MPSLIIRSFTGAIEVPSPVISVVTPCMIFDAARPSTRTLNSDWPSMSMNPGATTSPDASIVWRAGRPASRPIAAIRSPVMAMSPSNQGAPVPSTMRPPVIRTSNGRRRLLGSQPGERDGQSGSQGEHDGGEQPGKWSGHAADATR